MARPSKISDEKRREAMDLLDKHVPIETISARTGVTITELYTLQRFRKAQEAGHDVHREGA